jgi:adenylate cyclase
LSDVAEAFAFGLFRMDTRRRTLLADGAPVTLHARAFDVLAFLIANRDRVVSRDEIVAHVWRGIAVGENNLNVQLSALRRALVVHGAEGLIVTLPGRGYRFVGDVAPADAPLLDEVPDQAVFLPEARDALAAAVKSRAAERFGRFRAGISIGALLGMCALGVAVMVGRGVPSAAPPRLSIVVLPFRALGDGSVRDDLADAITDDLTTDLSRMPGSLVIARASAEVYKGRRVAADRIGRDLNVRYVIEGSVEAVQGKIRANVRLIDAPTNTVIPNGPYYAEMGRLWEAQDDIVRQIDSALDMVLTHEEVARATRDRPSQQDALDLFFHARSVLDRDDSLESMTEAQHLLERVTAAEPDFVDALTTLGWLLVRKLQTYDYPDYPRDSDEADRVTAHALAQALSNPNALAARARFLSYSGRCADAEPALEAALARDPNNALALQSSAVCAWMTGQPERVMGPEQLLLHLDPQGPAASGRYQLLGLGALFAGRPAEAVLALRRAEGSLLPPPEKRDAVTPVETTQSTLIAATWLAGDTAEARRRYAAYRAAWPHRTAWRLMALFNGAQSRLPQFARIGEALRQAGMPQYADEHEDDHVAPSAAPLADADFTPTPMSLPGGRTVDTAALSQLLRGQPAPIVIDVGRLCAVVPTTLEFSDAEAGLDRQALDATEFGRRVKAAPGAAIVVVGTGTFGSSSYNAALRLVALGYRNVAWYRGGEEAWAAAALPAQDRRSD